MAKSDFKFMTKIRVRWMECDGQGIVYNGAYLGYLDLPQHLFQEGCVRGRMVDQRALGGLDRLTTPAPMSARTAKVRKATW